MKTKIFIFVALLFAAFVFEGCKKKNEEVTTRIEGRVLTYGTNDPVVNEPIHIRFLAWQYDYTFEVGETYTNNEGYFFFETTTDDKAITDYLIRLEEREYPNHNGQGGSVFNERNKIPKGFQGTKNIYLSPHAWARFHIKNVNPQQGDKFSVSVSGNFEIFNGESNVTRTYKVFGNTGNRVAYSLYRNGVYTNWQDTVFMPAFDTTFVKVEY